MKTDFTEQQGLAVINEMIEQARHNIRKGSVNTFIFMGYTLAVLALCNYALLHILDRPCQSYWIWTLVIPSFIINSIIMCRNQDKKMMKTQMYHIIKSIWWSLNFCAFTFAGLILWLAFTWKNYDMLFWIIPCSLLMNSIAEFITARVCRFKPLLFGSILMWVGATFCVASLFIWKMVDVQLLILSATMILSFIVPGHLLNKKAN